MCARDRIHDDIPRMANEYGDAIQVGDHYRGIYNMAPAPIDENHATVMTNPDLKILTDAGGARRTPNTNATTDVLHLKPQQSFFPTFVTRRLILKSNSIYHIGSKAIYLAEKVG